MDTQQHLVLEELGVLEFNRRMTGLAAVTTYAEAIRQDAKWSEADRKLCWYLLKLSWKIEEPLTAKRVKALLSCMQQACASEPQTLYGIIKWIETKWHIQPITILKEWSSCIKNEQKTAPHTHRIYQALRGGRFENRWEYKLWYICECILELLSMQATSDTLIALTYDPDYPAFTQREFCVLLDLGYILTMRYSNRFSEYIINQQTLALYLTESAIKLTKSTKPLHAPLHDHWQHSLAQDIALYKQLVAELDRYYHHFLQTALNPR